MTVCRYYQQGNCKFGNRCRFEHPGASTNQNQPQNRFGALGAGGNGANQNGLEKYKISLDTIKADLTTETPQWILSAYAPGRDAPEQLFGGYPREQSFEEMRLHYLTGKASASEQQAISQAQELYRNAQQQMQNAASNVSEAANFIIAAENRHPNRHDICLQGTQGQPFGEFLVGKRPALSAPAPQTAQANPFSTSGPGRQQSPFGGPGPAAPPATSAFGQPSTLGQRPTPFGQQQPSQATPAFGQPSQPANPFGQPSKPPAQQAPAFGQPSQPTSAFGQPSQLGAKPSPFGAPAFGQPSQPAAQQSAFGQPSQLGQKPNPFSSAPGATASPFGASGGGAAAAAPTPSPFGQPSQPQANAGPSPFGSAPTTQPQPGASPFGKPAQAEPSGAFGQPSAPAASPFGSGNQGTSGGNPFEQKPTQQPSPFATGQPQQSQSQPAGGAFGQPPAPSNPFAQNQTTGSASQPTAQAQPAAQGGAPTASPYPPDSTRQHPPVSSYSAKGMDGRLSMFRDKPVTYNGDGLPGIRQFDGTWQRIWFPDGPPPFNRDTALPAGDYDEKSRAQWAAFAETGEFSNGIMPELPPPRECTLWNF